MLASNNTQALSLHGYTAYIIYNIYNCQSCIEQTSFYDSFFEICKARKSSGGLKKAGK
jgi:hypothetical protein